ncbi:MAG TPA: SDR family oxidoreductase [Caulobacteraceae bacterium]|nr:SDR family oxidoreductase [Caulobacteraceae bacterium]
MLSPDDILLTDQVAIVTGGGQGLGEGAALNFARFGADVVIADKNAEAAESVAAKVRELGRRALGVRCDVRRLDEVEAMTEQAMTAFGRVDILVNNAGGVRRAPFLDLKERGWQKHIELNLTGLFAPTEAAVRAMIAGGRGGSVINVASIEAFRAAPHRSVYGACKAGMINFTRTLALEVAEHGIRVNAIAPDIIATPGIGLVTAEGDGPPARMAALRRHVPMGRPGHTDDTAGACVFLASSLSRYVTGTTIHVDGGTWASSGWSRDDQGRWKLFEGFADAY